MLQNSLSGSSKIVVLATLGPSVRNYQESLSTLQFAARCKEIQLTPLNHASIIQDDEEVSALKERIIELEGAQAKRQEEAFEVIETKDHQIALLHKTIQDMQSEAQQIREYHQALQKAQQG